jgi:hypothetical protein
MRSGKRKYWFTIFTWSIFVYFGNAQNTFSKVYDLGVGLDNRAQQFFLDDNSFVVGTTHSGDTSVVSAFTRFDYEGNIIDQNSYSDYVFGRSRSVVRNEDGFEVAGHTWSLDKSLTRSLELVKLNNNLEFIDRIPLFYEVEQFTNLPGILDLNDSLKVVYGSFFDSGPGIDSGANIGVLDKQSDSIFTEIIMSGSTEYPYIDFDVYDLQQTKDSQLIFIAETRQRDDSVTKASSYFEIVKLNLEGEITKKIVSDKNGSNQVLSQDAEGNIYFYNNFTPFVLDSTLNFPDRLGGLVKLNAELDSVLWSFQINEKDNILGHRSHEVLGITPLHDGNFLGYGRVQFLLSEIPEVIGFICKFSKNGEILWVREYGIPIPEEHLDLSILGVLGSGRIEDCKELDDGRILCIGENAYAKPELSFYRELWILMLDENGCIELDCDPTTILTSTSSSVDLQQGKVYPNPVSDVLHIGDVSFDRYKIYDLMGRLVQEGNFTTKIELRDQLSSGMYVLQLKEEGKLKSVFKFFRQAR